MEKGAATTAKCVLQNQIRMFLSEDTTACMQSLSRISTRRKMLRRKNLRQSNWLIELSPRESVEPQIVGICSTFRGSTFSA